MELEADEACAEGAGGLAPAAAGIGLSVDVFRRSPWGLRRLQTIKKGEPMFAGSRRGLI